MVRHTLVRTDKIADAVVAAADFNELFQRGSAVAVTRTGRYVVFATAYGGSAEVFISPRGSAAVLVANRVRRGSFQVQLTAAGTARLDWQAWGPRA